MNKFNFKYLGDLIIISGVIYGENTAIPRKLILALDTASTKTILQPENADLIGYSEKDKIRDVGITTGSKTEKGYELKISKLDCLGYEWNKPSLIIKKLPFALYFIDGLIGLDFFQSINKKLIIDFENNAIQIL